jgi:hypothetical protein
VAIARPLSDLPRFLTAVAVGSKEAAAEASNAGALVMVRAIRSRQETRRLRSSAISGGKRTGRGVGAGYLAADAKKAKYQPTALVTGRGPVHILENDLRPHKITLGVVRGPDGRIRDIVSPRGNRVGRRRGTAGPSLRDAGFGQSTMTFRHPGVRRTSGPFQRGVTASRGDVERKWTKVFANESLRVKGW